MEETRVAIVIQSHQKNLGLDFGYLHPNTNYDFFLVI